MIDKDAKNINDRTWCFWEKQNGLFENIVYHRWQQIDFYSKEFSARYDLEPYQYKMIRSIDLYAIVLDKAKQFSNIDIVYDEIKSISSNEIYATITTNNSIFYSNYLFNSIILNNWKQDALSQKNVHVLWQHFKGWLIETADDIFDARIATFMDFRVSQEKGTAFMYVLPVAKNRALIEYTLFSENILNDDEYNNALTHHINKQLEINEYKLLHTESGIIPMTNYAFSKGEGRVINIGTAGGQTKGSSGYTFQFIQKHSAKIIEALVKDKNPLLLQSMFDKRFRLYDGILLNVLKHKKMGGDVLFAQLFKNNSPQAVFKFLDNETNIKEELKIMKSVSLRAFLPATFKQLLRHL
ncbi:lycopene beta-cyclase [Parafilimonas terrae]|uniref:Lycopene beta-cyclase n=1 Tax=Parafilimonas terrae TaxID=1465490 RepID=A0A1I5VNV2_9BACT|nr:lycopene beta-cyclase [Parafilimonas terrae]